MERNSIILGGLLLAAVIYLLSSGVIYAYLAAIGLVMCWTCLNLALERLNGQSRLVIVFALLTIFMYFGASGILYINESDVARVLKEEGTVLVSNSVSTLTQSEAIDDEFGRKLREWINIGTDGVNVYVLRADFHGIGYASWESIFEKWVHVGYRWFYSMSWMVGGLGLFVVCMIFFAMYCMPKPETEQ